jgi:hypothetical protein
MNPVAPPRKKFETGPGARLVLGFREDAPAAGDDGVGGQDIGAGVTRDYRLRLFLRKAHRVGRRQLGAAGGLVNIGGIDAVGH